MTNALAKALSISEAYRNRPTSVKPEDIRWHAMITDRLIRDASKPRPLSYHSLPVAIGIARYLLTENLYPWTPDQTAFKTRLLRHLHLWLKK